jgi:tol-pal system protein YbgF
MISKSIKNLLMRFLRPALLGLPASALILLCLPPDCHAISQTKKDIQELQRNVFVLQSDMADLKAQMKSLPSEEAIKQIRQSQAEMLTQISELLRDLQVLMGRFEESRYFTDKLLNDTSAEMEVLKTKVDAKTGGLTKKESENLITQIAGIETQLASINERLAAIEKVTGKLPPEKVAKKPKKKTPDDVYEAALDTYKKNKHEEARKMMEAFIKEFPDHKLAGNAQFWIAETYYTNKDYTDAILAYEDLLQRYKDHGKIPAALLKQALSFLEMGDKKAARGILRELIENHPDSKQAKTAREKLNTLEGTKSESSNAAGPPAKPTATKKTE